MSKPVVNFTSLLDRAALEHLKSKTLLPSFSHYDVWLYEHAVGFTVAKMMNADLLQTTQNALVQAMESGESYDKFVKKLKPYLMSQGWWGETVMTDPVDGVAKNVQLGSTRRLRVIFQTNMATAYAAGQWARVQEDKREFPFLKYIASTAEQKRQSHMTYYGKIWRVDDPIWQSIFPPNGYGCQCTVRQLTEKQALRERENDLKTQPENFTDRQKANHAKGIIDDGTDDIQWREFVNPRTGQKVQVPFDVSPSFAHNHGDRMGILLDLVRERHGTFFETNMLNQLHRYISVRGNMDLPDFNKIRLAENTAKNHSDALFLSSSHIIAEGQKIAEKYADVMKYWEKAGKPHHAIAEIMQLEGVELAGTIATKGSNRELRWELTQAVKMYPKDWVEKSNALGAILVEGKHGRAFYLYPPQDDLFGYIQYALKQPKNSHFHESLKKDLLALGDSLISVNLKHSDWVERKSSIIHEFAHRLQTVMPDLQNVFLRFFLESTRNERMVSRSELLGIIPNNQQEEWFKLDHFPIPYYGRMYAPNNTQDPQPLELMTMIFQALLGGGQYYQHLIKAENRKFFYFGLAILVRWRA